jgi:alanyl-tRNA synthetase
VTARELRDKYLRFFQSKNHQLYPSGSLIPYDVTGRLDESLLFNGAGMVQFKPFFRGSAKPPHPRLTNSQKCVRTGDIEEVGDLSHLTFFEMLGNFSFGDYFKQEAIAYSWEFLTSAEWLGLDPQRLSFTVFEEDDEAFDLWAGHLRSVGIDPGARIFRLGEETNFWPAGSFSSGPPGPCGPNTEMFYWVAAGPPPSAGDGGYSREDWVRDEAEGKWLEIWNDVFIQYEWQGRLKNPSRPAEGYVKEGMPPLPFKSVDTGMGLERTVTVLNGNDSVYANDLFLPILKEIGRLMEAAGPKPAMGRQEAPFPDEEFPFAIEDEPHDIAARIIADHVRNACFCIADGILPSNSGRGYVLRRLIRRAVLKGQRVLGFDDLFLYKLYEPVASTLGDHYVELRERSEVILETLRNEEVLFRRKLVEGMSHFLTVLYNLGPHEYKEGKATVNLPAKAVFPGNSAFKLHSTYGFPLEVTQELAHEAGLEVDLEEYEEAMREEQERNRGASGMENVYADQGEALVVSVSDRATPESRFVGYDRLEHATEIVQISPRFGPDGLTNGQFQVCLAETPFYAESGGQVGDTGTIESAEFSFRVSNTWKEMGLIWHDCEIAVSAPHDVVGRNPQEITDLLNSGFFFKPVFARVDAERRRKIIRNHSATHLLHAALRQVLGKHVTQAGSMVQPDYLRFDFTHGKAMTQEEIAEVERIVNEKALTGEPVQIDSDVPLDEARQRGAMALFGEKYGERVRVVQMGDFSVELCGGCHVRQTSEIGLFKILSESSAASGVRRIEAVTGEGAYEWVRQQTHLLREAASVLKAQPNELVHAATKAVDALREERRRRERAEAAAAAGGGSATSSEVPTAISDAVALWTRNFGEIDQKIAAGVIDDQVARDPKLIALGSVITEGKVIFICKVGKDAQAGGAHAGNLIREVAKIAGGGGGGRPDFATAGGKQPEKAEEALAAAESLVRQQVGG